MKYIIDFVDSITDEVIQQWLTENQAVIVRQFDNFTKTYVVEAATTPVKTDFIEHINEDVEFSSQLLTTVSASIDPEVGLETGTFSTENDWWKTATIQEANYDNPTIDHIIRGAKTTVYLFDSGIKADHPEFENAKISNLYTIDGSFDDTKGHGTALASLIVGKTCGITNSTVKNVKIFSTTQATMLSDLTHALDVTLAEVLANSTKFNIINMSWAIPKNTYIESKINALINAGAIVIASAGNNGVPIEEVTPASMDRVVTIGSYNEAFHPASFSDYTGPLSTTQDFTNHGEIYGWAPGVNIKVASLDGATMVAGGTSLSAAIVSACIAFNGDYYYYNDELVYTHDFNSLAVVYSTFGKANILDLSDPKYATSVNKIAMFITDVPTGNKVASITNTTQYADIYPNVPSYSQLMWTQTITSITVTGDIPSGLSLSGGWLIGTVVEEVLEEYMVPLLVTYVFNTGEVSTKQLEVTVHKSSDAVPQPNTTVDVSLQVGCFCNWTGSYCQRVGQCGNTPCFGCKNCGSLKSPACICSGSTCI